MKLPEVKDQKMKRLDIYRKVPKDLTQPTTTGAIISICSCFFMAYLFLAELKEFLTIEVTSTLAVEDPIKHSEKLPVFLNISLLKMSCEYIGLDIQDEMGRHEVGFQDNTHKEPIDNGIGCRFESHFLINKVPGNFHVSTHSSSRQPEDPDMSHIIHKLRFGTDLEEGKVVKGSFNPLENIASKNSDPENSHDYILRVVPSKYENRRGHVRFPFQYSYSYRDVLQYTHSGRAMPAIWFRYELSPITVTYVEESKPFYTFLIMICAIIGGTFTVVGIIDSMVFSASEIIKKFELGKLS